MIQSIKHSFYLTLSKVIVIGIYSTSSALKDNTTLSGIKDRQFWYTSFNVYLLKRITFTKQPLLTSCLVTV